VTWLSTKTERRRWCFCGHVVFKLTRHYFLSLIFHADDLRAEYQLIPFRVRPWIPFVLQLTVKFCWSASVDCWWPAGRRDQCLQQLFLAIHWTRLNVTLVIHTNAASQRAMPRSFWVYIAARKGTLSYICLPPTTHNSRVHFQNLTIACSLNSEKRVCWDIMHKTRA